MTRKKLGRFYGVGLGPGDPELVTLRAGRILSQVPVIFVPAKDSQSQSYAKSILRSLIRKPGQKLFALVLPMLKGEEKLRQYWQEAADTIWHHLEQGTDCAFVNVGDPLLYGTFIHILQTLQKNHPEVEVEVVPGISSINAAAARAITPLASGDERIAIISGNHEDDVIRETLKNFDTVIFMKVNTIFARLLAILEEMDLLGKCIYVRRCTTQDEEIVRDISRLKGKRVDYFSLLIVRK